MRSFIQRHKTLILITLFLFVVGAILLARDIATTKNKLYIETAQTEDHFLVLCEWYGSGSFAFHGGAKRVNYKVIVSKSNTEIDCGWSYYGDFVVQILHPLYRRMSTHDQPHPTIRHQNGKLIFAPIAFDRYMLSLPKIYEGDESYLYDVARELPSGQLDHYYITNYLKVREFDIEQFKALYHDRFLTYWQISNEIQEPTGKSVSPVKAVESVWKKAQRTLKEHHEKR